jgi:hypothetical protein
VATIIGYRSAISSKHKGWGGRSVSTNGDLSELIKGIFSYLKFPSFTDNACNSLTLDAVANAIKNTVFHVKNFTSQDKRGSKSGSHNLLCPYKALKMYIKRTESQRKEIDSDSLFITYQKGVCRPVSKNSVASIKQGPRSGKFSGIMSTHCT